MQNFRQLTEEIYGAEEMVYTTLKSSHGCDQEKVSDISKSRSWKLWIIEYLMSFVWVNLIKTQSVVFL